MALSYIVTGPNGGKVGAKAGPFYVVPSEVTTDTITLSTIGGSGTFTPSATLQITNSGDRVPFWFTSTQANNVIQLASALGATMTPDIMVYRTTATTRSRGLKWLPNRS